MAEPGYVERLFDQYMGRAISSYEANPDEDRTASAELKRLLKYHGAPGMVIDNARKESYFMRGGRRVNLAVPPEEYR
jgi:hypothetical protein